MTGIPRGLAALYLSLWVGGVLSYGIQGDPPAGFSWTAPLYLTVAGALVLAWTPVRQWRWPLLAAGIGFASEVIGVQTGFPFGSYRYTPVLGPAILGVPLVLTAAWLVLVALVQGVVGRRVTNRVHRMLAGAAAMTTVDLLIDPLAAGPLGYWTWSASGAWFGIPGSNFAGWFGVSALIFLALPPSWHPSRAVIWLGISVVGFFALVAVALAVRA